MLKGKYNMHGMGITHFSIDNQNDFKEALNFAKQMEMESAEALGNTLFISKAINKVATSLSKEHYSDEIIEFLSNVPFDYEDDKGFYVTITPSQVKMFDVQPIVMKIIDGIVDYLDYANPSIYIRENEDYYEEDLARLENYLNNQETINKMLHFCSLRNLKIDGLSPLSEDELKDLEEQEELVSMDEFHLYRGLLKKIYDEYKISYWKYVRRQQGLVHTNGINKVIDKVISKHKLTEEESKVVDGFFDTYMGMMSAFNGDSSEVDKIIQQQFFS